MASKAYQAAAKDISDHIREIASKEGNKPLFKDHDTWYVTASYVDKHKLDDFSAAIFNGGHNKKK